MCLTDNFKNDFSIFHKIISSKEFKELRELIPVEYIYIERKDKRLKIQPRNDVKRHCWLRNLVCDNDRYANNASSIYVLQRSLYISVIVMILISFFVFLLHQLIHGEYRDDVTSFVTIIMGVIPIVYWNMRQLFSDKWTYLADLYNKLTVDVLTKRYDNIITKLSVVHYVQSNFALDALRLDMWSHRSFCAAFVEIYVYATAFRFFKEAQKIDGVHLDCLSPIVLNKLKSEFNEMMKGKPSSLDTGKVLSEYNSFLSDCVALNNITNDNEPSNI